MGKVVLAVVLACCLAPGTGLCAPAPAATLQSRTAGGTPARNFGHLKGPQVALFEQYAADRSRNAAGLSAAQLYASLSESQRASYEAITHALMNSPLTDQAGKRMGNALDLVASLEGVAGQIEGEGGDKQFRLYVSLTPEAQDTLARSREFFRDKDNTVFHREYPTSYRQRGSVPNLQFSMTRAGDRADIDVDYRSSRIPQALINGHLRPANSDVRAGANFFKHVTHWFGLLRWWRPLREKEERRLGKIAARQAATAPPSSAGPAGGRAITLTPEQVEEGRKVAAEMHNFLSSWLVERDVRAAAEFLTRHPTACVSVDVDEEDEVLRAERARGVFAQALNTVIRAGAARRSLADAVTAIQPWDPELISVEGPNANLFTLHAIQRDEAAEFRCDPAKLPGDADAYGEFFVTYFTLTCPDCGGMKLLWTKDEGRWQIISYDLLEP